MLTGKTYTPDLEAEAAILPGVPPHLRAQMAREQARLLEHGRSIENPRPAGPRDNLNIAPRTRYLLIFGEREDARTVAD